MKPGPPPKPQAILELRGSTLLRKRAKKVASLQRVPVKGQITPPAWLSPEELDCWRQIVPQLQEMKIVTKADAFTLGRYCNAMVLWLLISSKMKNQPLLVKSEINPTPYQNPYLKIRGEVARELQALEDRFGLTPSARVGLHLAATWLPGAEEDDKPTPIEGEEFFKVK